MQGLRDLKKELEGKEAAAKDYKQMFKKITPKVNVRWPVLSLRPC